MAAGRPAFYNLHLTLTSSLDARLFEVCPAELGETMLDPTSTTARACSSGMSLTNGSSCPSGGSVSMNSDSVGYGGEPLYLEQQRCKGLSCTTAWVVPSLRTRCRFVWSLRPLRHASDNITKVTLPLVWKGEAEHRWDFNDSRKERHGNILCLGCSSDSGSFTPGRTGVSNRGSLRHSSIRLTKTPLCRAGPPFGQPDIRVHASQPRCGQEPLPGVPALAGVRQPRNFNPTHSRLGEGGGPPSAPG